MSIIKPDTFLSWCTLKDLRIIILVLISLLSYTKSKAQDIAPQIWNNAYLGWNINDQFSLRNVLSYNVLLSEDFPWNEISFSTTGIYSFHKYFEASAGLYLARVKQSLAIFLLGSPQIIFSVGE